MTAWLTTLETETPEEGYALAVKMARVAVKQTQPDASVRERLRPQYAEDPDALIAISQVVATHFATVAAANDYWRGRDERGGCPRATGPPLPLPVVRKARLNTIHLYASRVVRGLAAQVLRRSAPLRDCAGGGAVQGSTSIVVRQV